jgi:CheY-like chemotaxis protein
MVGSLVGVRVLVVDDDEDTLDMCRMVLELQGATVTTATRSRDGLALLCTGEPFDVLVSDIAMPGEDGYWLIEQVRALQSDVRAIPALALSAHATASDRAGAVSAGYQIHAAKPIEPAVLVALLQSLLL